LKTSNVLLVQEINPKT